MRLDRIAGLAVCAVVAGGLVAGFALLGTPQHARLVQLDERRIDDLGAIAERLTRGAGLGATRTGGLPVRLRRDLVLRRGDGSDGLSDPATGAPYGYAREGAIRYRLCATFALPAEPAQPAYRGWPAHAAGRVCYHFDAMRLAQPLAVGGAGDGVQHY